MSNETHAIETLKLFGSGVQSLQAIPDGAGGATVEIGSIGALTSLLKVDDIQPLNGQPIPTFQHFNMQVQGGPYVGVYEPAASLPAWAQRLDTAYTNARWLTWNANTLVMEPYQLLNGATMEWVPDVAPIPTYLKPFRQGGGNAQFLFDSWDEITIRPGIGGPENGVFRVTKPGVSLGNNGAIGLVEFQSKTINMYATGWAASQLNLLADSTPGGNGTIKLGFDGYCHWTTYAFAELMRLTVGGNLGIGTPTPAHKLDVNGNSRVSGRQLGASAAVVAANDLTLGATNQNVVSGATTINAINTTGWTAGSRATLVFSGAPLVKHNTAGGVGTAVLLLSSSLDFQAAADSVLTIEYDGTSWHEVSRKVA